MREAPKLRSYQFDDLNKIVVAFNNGTRRVLYQAPTGSGKTVLFADLIKEVADASERALVLAHRDEIVQQVSKSLDALGVRHGIIAAGYPETLKRNVQVASVFTLVRRLHRLQRHPPTLLVIDEAHHAVAKTWTKIIDALPDTDVLGVTATPRRLDGKPLGDVFEELIVGPSIASLIDDDWLSPVTVFTPPRGPDLSKVKIRAGDYAIDQLSSVMSGTVIINGAVKEYERLCPDAPAIAFCVDIAHSKLVAEAFRRCDYRAEHVDGDTPRNARRDLISALANGEIDVLSNCGIVSEGLDVPGVEAAILLRPTKSLSLYLQMVGRALRPGKDLAYVLDHAGNTYRHGLPEARRRWTLHGRQQPTGDGDGLIRCPHCGAMNAPRAVICEHCGAELPHHERQPHVEIDGTRLVEAIEAPVDECELSTMSYRAVLRWCAGNDGLLMRSRLERVARVRNYSMGWVYHNERKNWETAWQQAQRWRVQQG